ncbi:Heavy metal-associated domain, HMA, partial [Dillenia turbinata]
EMVFVCKTLNAHQVDDATVPTDKRGTHKEVRPKAGKRRDDFPNVNDGKKYETKAKEPNVGLELLSLPSTKSRRGKSNTDGKMFRESKSNDGRAEEVRIVVLSMQLHCEGCNKRIRRDILRIPGVKSVEIDAFEDQVTVEGSLLMDDIAFANHLKEKFKRPVRVVPPPKKLDHGDGNKDVQPSENKESEDEKIEEEEENEGSDNNKDGDKEEEQEPEEKEQTRKMEIFKGYPHYNDLIIVPNPWQQFHGRYYLYGLYHADPYTHASQMFSDENPNACSIV